NEQLAALLEPSGIKVASVPATHTFDTKTLQAGWSHRSAAFVAGLGRFGLNRMLIGPAGGAGRYGTAFLSVELPPSPKYDEDHCLYLKSGQCRACARDCPVGALTENGYDRHLCYQHLLKISADLGYADGSLDVCGKCDVAGPCALIK
ncbi:hypothetical protein LJB99_05360, partial [Deltaproteobacteria bacterium OttesenSCG-928-K17]|nr:hypothetical protein [Deltaproteobacteria bacterium OttesenSCG-928-K17]